MNTDKLPPLSLTILVKIIFLQMAYFRGYFDLSIKIGRPVYTRCVRKVSDLRLYLRARALDWPLRGMSVTSSPSRSP